MVARTSHRTKIPRTTLTAILVALTAALVARSVLQIQLLENGLQASLAADASYLVVPAVMTILLFPLWRTECPFLAVQFRLSDLSWRIVSKALAVGLLLRVIWWCQLVVGTSFGIYQSSDSSTTVGPTFSFQCATPAALALGVLVMGMLTPAIEEIVTRAYVLNALRHRGLIISVVVSALVFTVFHRLSSWPFTIFAGLVLGAQYWSTASLWSSLISHLTVNSLTLIDWRCLSGRWNPRAEDLPLLQPGLIAIGTGVVCLGALLIILRSMATGARMPR